MIRIAERLRSFSHQNGACCLIPGTSYLVKAYPTRILILSLDGSLQKEHLLNIQGPLKNFTVMQDLERGCVTVFSESYCLHVLPSLDISFRKNPPVASLSSLDRLSLGSHKKQEWEEILRRKDLREVFPFWLRLGSLLPFYPRQGGKGGMFTLLEKCKEAITSNRSECIVPAFHELFLAAFSNWLIPRFVDEEYQGILATQTESEGNSPLCLLSESAELIRSLFFSIEGNAISLLPHLPPEFFSGRFLHLQCPFGHIDFEWTKKSLRRVHVFAQQNGEIRFHFPRDLHQCRLKLGLSDKGQTLANGDLLVIKSGTHYLLDQFQK